MHCLNPIAAYFERGKRTDKGKRSLNFSPKTLSYLQLRDGGIPPDVLLPCGKCVLCRDAKAKRWQRRLQMEALDKSASFLTLTYDDEHLEDCNKKAVQKFLKRFRQLSRLGLDLRHFKYFFVSEYGHNTHRPHYHAILFGVDLLKDPFFKSRVATSKRDARGRIYPVFTSDVISRIWKNGFNSVDKCTDKSIRYVCKYVSKTIADTDKNLFHLFSRRIGTSMFIVGDTLLPFAYSTLSSGKLLLNRDSFPVGSPKFLDYYFELHDPDFLSVVKDKRKAFVRNKQTDMKSIKCLASHVMSITQAQRKNEIL